MDSARSHAIGKLRRSGRWHLSSFPSAKTTFNLGPFFPSVGYAKAGFNNPVVGNFIAQQALCLGHPKIWPGPAAGGVVWLSCLGGLKGRTILGRVAGFRTARGGSLESLATACSGCSGLGRHQSAEEYIPAPSHVMSLQRASAMGLEKLECNGSACRKEPVLLTLTWASCRAREGGYLGVRVLRYTSCSFTPRTFSSPALERLLAKHARRAHRDPQRDRLGWLLQGQVLGADGKGKRGDWPSRCAVLLGGLAGLHHLGRQVREPPDTIKTKRSLSPSDARVGYHTLTDSPSATEPAAFTLSPKQAQVYFKASHFHAKVGKTEGAEEGEDDVAKIHAAHMAGTLPASKWNGKYIKMCWAMKWPAHPSNGCQLCQSHNSSWQSALDCEA